MFVVAIILWIISFLLAGGTIIAGVTLSSQLGVSLFYFILAALIEWCMIFGYGCILNVLDVMEKNQLEIKAEIRKAIKELSGRKKKQND